MPRAAKTNWNQNFQNPLGDDIFRNTTIALSGPKSTRQSQPIVLQSPLHLLTNNTSCQQQPLDARRQPGIQFSQDEMEGFETKRICQFIKREFSDRWPCYSNLIFNTNEMSCHSPKENLNLQVFVKEGNAVDLALEWGHELQQFIPTINTANEETVGGCWELNKTSPSEEEILCRRRYYNFKMKKTVLILTKQPCRCLADTSTRKPDFKPLSLTRLGRSLFSFYR